MHRTQLFELSVRGLASLELPESMDEGIEAELKRLFRRPLGKLAQQLGVEESLARELGAAVEARNQLAHNYLLDAIFRIRTSTSTLGDEVKKLKLLNDRYERLNEKLDAIEAHRFNEQGISEVDFSDVDLHRVFLEPFSDGEG